MRLPFPATLAAASQQEPAKKAKGRKRASAKPEPTSASGVQSHAELLGDFRSIMRENVANIERANKVRKARASMVLT
jgi:hypothetical protein